MLTVLLGGARSGKSTLAVRMALAWEGPVVFVATATASDDEMRARIARHREERPAHWTTVEEPRDLGGALRGALAEAFVIVDCLTLWASTLLVSGVATDAIVDLARADAKTAAARRAPTVVVSNEVGSGVVPDNTLGRHFRDLQGSVNATWVASSDRAALVVAGRVVPLEDPQWT